MSAKKILPQIVNKLYQSHSTFKILHSTQVIPSANHSKFNTLHLKPSDSFFFYYAHCILSNVYPITCHVYFIFPFARCIFPNVYFTGCFVYLKTCLFVSFFYLQLSFYQMFVPRFHLHTLFFQMFTLFFQMFTLFFFVIAFFC